MADPKSFFLGAEVHDYLVAHGTPPDPIQRELIRISTDVIQSAYEDTTDVLDLLDRAEKNLFEIAQNNLRRDSRKKRR